jgi:hypothetical protein
MKTRIVLFTLLCAAVGSVQSVYAAVSERSVAPKRINAREAVRVEFSASHQRVDVAALEARPTPTPRPQPTPYARPTPASQADAFATTASYVETFYPLWFTYGQSRLEFSGGNRIVGPDQISSLYQVVVAINDDTLYGSTVLDLTQQPVILTVPTTIASYSVLTLDPFGNVFDSGIPSHHPNDPPLPTTTYALYGPDFTGTLPPGVTPIAISLNYTWLIFRADKFSPDGQNQTMEANQFRMSLSTLPLCTYVNETCPPDTPPGGPASIVPEVEFSEPFKTVADALIATNAIEFLRQLQVAVHAPNTPPLSPADQALSDHFDSLFNGQAAGSDFIAGAQSAHALLLENYLTHIDANNWIHFTNIGAWGHNVVDRASITEFIQYGNGITTAAYYHTFKDGTGSPLNGDDPRGYVMTFPPGGQPDASRFWSVTAYTPQSIELIANPANKYVVASYTPGLQPNPDGSVSIYMSRALPNGVPMANWLPIPRRAFNIMLRIYGVVPGSPIANNTYVPPPIEKVH